MKLQCTLLEVWNLSSEQEKAEFIRFISNKPKVKPDPTALEKIILAAERSAAGRIDESSAITIASPFHRGTIQRQAKRKRSNLI